MPALLPRGTMRPSRAEPNRRPLSNRRMTDRYAFKWIDREARQGPLFSIGRDVYERPRLDQRVILLRAVESYPGPVAATAIKAFADMAETWKAPIIFIIDPNLLLPPAVRFLFEWSRATHAMGAVERSYMKTGNAVSGWMGKLVLRVFTDGAMPFTAIGGDALNADLARMDLSCGRAGFALVQPSTALVRREDAPPSLIRSILRRAGRRLSGAPKTPLAPPPPM
jgi:hypothetical protein